MNLFKEVLLLLATVTASFAVHHDTGNEFTMSNCNNLIGEERTACVQENQINLQAQTLNTLAKLEETRLLLEGQRLQSEERREEKRLQFEQTRLLFEENRLNFEKTIALAKDRRENIIFENNLQKDAVILEFPGLAIDPQDAKSWMVALITLASLVAFGIVSCCDNNSQQPMLIVSSFALILSTALSVLVFSFPSKWVHWLITGALLSILTAILPIHFLSAKLKTKTYQGVLSSASDCKEIMHSIIVSEVIICLIWVLFMNIQYSFLIAAVILCALGYCAFIR